VPVEPAKLFVLLLATVKVEHVTASQSRTFDHADTPGAVPEQIAVYAFPPEDVYPLLQETSLLSPVLPRKLLVSLLPTVKLGHATTKQVKLLNVPLVEHVAVPLPEYPASHVTSTD